MTAAHWWAVQASKAGCPGRPERSCAALWPHRVPALPAHGVACPQGRAAFPCCPCPAACRPCINAAGQLLLLLPLLPLLVVADSLFSSTCSLWLCSCCCRLLENASPYTPALGYSQGACILQETWSTWQDMSSERPHETRHLHVHKTNIALSGNIR